MPLPAPGIPNIAADTSGVGASMVFGEGSMLADAAIQAAVEDGQVLYLSDHIFFRLVVLALLLVYCVVMMRYGAYVVSVLGMARGRLYVEKMLEEQNYLFDRFVSICNVIALFAVGIALVKWIDISWGEYVYSWLPWWGVMLGVMLISAVVAVVNVLQRVMIQTGGSVTLNTNLTQKLILFRRLVYTSFCIMVVPMIILASLSGPQTAKFFLIVAFSEVCIISLFFLFRTYLLFVEQKISILYWFLYLCAVEIFPYTVPVAIILRNI